MLSYTAHLVLPCLQVVEHPGLGGKLGIDGQCLDCHTHRVQETLVGATVVDGCEQRLLFVVIFGQQETIGRREEIALEDAIFLAEGIHIGHIHVKRPHHTGLCVLWFLQVGHQLREAVAAVEVPGIPLLAFIEGGGLAQFCFCHSHLRHRHGLGLQCSAAIDLVDVAQHHLQCGAVADDMMDVEEEIVVPGIPEQADMEEAVVVDVEGNDERLTVPGSMFQVQCSMFRVQ